MTLKQYYAFSLSAPLLVCGISLVPLSLGYKNEFISGLNGLLIFGMPGYILFFPYILFKIQRTDEINLKKLSLLAPLIYLPFYFAGLIGGFYFLEFADDQNTIAKNIAQSLGFGLMVGFLGSPIALAIAYIFVGITHGFRKYLEANHLIIKAS